MKIYHKNSLVLLFLFAVIFFVGGYFTYSGVHLIQENTAQRTSELVAIQVMNYIDSWFSDQSDSTWDENTSRRFREYLQAGSEQFREVEGLYILNAAQDLIFSTGLLPDSLLIRSETDKVTNAAASSSDLTIRQNRQNKVYFASWRSNVKTNFKVIARLDPLHALDPILHGLAIRFYLLGFAGIFAVFILATLTSRIVKSPMQTMRQVLSNINNRKYGFRLKPAKEDEFYDDFLTANNALRRMEQIDSAQRTAVRRRTVLENEIKTISRFMDMLAHEVKNPLHAFGLNLDVLRTKIERDRKQDETLKHITILEKESEHLQDVVQGFLNYLRPGVPRKERININPLIKEVCEGMAREAEDGKIKIETRLGRKLPNVFIDKRQLQQALHNVIINAIHATGSGGKISIRTWNRRKRVFISVRDTGSGMEKEQLKKILDLYYTTKKDGSGLGLPITKRIIEANGGQMQIESQTGKGTTLTFMFNSV